MTSMESIQETLHNIRTHFDLVTFLESIDLGAYIVSPERRILYWSGNAQRITGYAPEEVVGKRCMDHVLSHVDRQGVQVCTSSLCPLYRSMTARKTSQVPFAVYALSKGGERIPMSVITFPLIQDGEVIGGVEIFQEIPSEHRDLVLAMNVQKSLIPQVLPENIQVFYHPSSLIGGDMIYVKDPWVGLVDVSGHGIASALISTSVRIILGEVLKPELDISELGAILEQRYQEFGQTDTYFTGVFVKREDGELKIVSFGHPAPLMLRKGTIQKLEIESDFPIGWGMEHDPIVTMVFLDQDESMLLYSDGLTEIKTEAGFLGAEGLVSILRYSTDLSEIYVQAMEQNVEQFQGDDVTMIIVSG